MKNSKNDRSTSESNSFALFGDGTSVFNNNNSDDLFNKNVKSSENPNKTKQVRSQCIDDESKSSKLDIEKNRSKAKRGFRTLKNNKNCIVTENNPDDTGGQIVNKTDRGNRNVDKKQQKYERGNNDSINKTGRNKQKIRENKRGTGVPEKLNTVAEAIDYKKYKLKDFEDTDKPLIYTITGSPRKTSNPFIVEVIIDDFRYKVSTWSVHENVYNQGLDSNFIVKHLKQNRRKINE